ncbi:VanZ family protein [Oceanobacillus picturae]|uniref:VanZ family protein n=1 Tax=Oceanobacillus picturae TaxID=171693 RepID=UPI00362A9F75
MRKLWLIVWVIVLCIGLFTESVGALLDKGQVSFSIQPRPSAEMYFPVSSLMQVSAFEMIGHSLMFAVLTYLLVKNVHRLHIAFILSMSFAIVTEIVQPFLGRGAEFFDLFANVIGITAVVLVYVIEKVLTRVSAASVKPLISLHEIPTIKNDQQS